MSLTNVGDGTAERLVTELFEGAIVYVPYVRPGFPLARAVGELATRIPSGAEGLALAHHGLVVWGDDAESCEKRLTRVVGRIDEYLQSARRGRRLGSSGRTGPSAEERLRRAELLLPVVRGALSLPERVVLHFDDGADVLAALDRSDMPELVHRGMATPEHLLRAGRLPLWLPLDRAAPDETLVAETGRLLAEARDEYEAYHRRHAATGQPPLHDWAKVILVPGLGMITAFNDKRGAVTANLCYRAVLETIENAEAVDRFEFLPEADVFEFEHWPLERRKLEEQIAARPRDPAASPADRGRDRWGERYRQAAARRDSRKRAPTWWWPTSTRAARRSRRPELAAEFPGRAIGVAVDVRDDASLDALFRRAVLEFGGLDCLFYTAGAAAALRPDHRDPP